MKKIILFMLFSSLLIAYDSNSKDNSEISLSIYNENFGVVKENRNMNIKKDDDSIIYSDVASQIETDSIIVKGADIYEFNYEYDLVNQQKLLNKYIGLNIFMEFETKDGKKTERKEYKLLSVYDGIVAEDIKTGEIFINPKGRMILPKLPQGLLLKPSLVWKVKKGTVNKNIDVSYITKGLRWESSYVINLNDKTMDMVSWVNINNNSGIDYNNANLKLIAGEVKRVEDNNIRPIMLSEVKFSRAIKENMQPEFKEKSFFDYHMYTLNSKVDLKNNQAKQIKLNQTEKVPYEKYYVYNANTYNTNTQIMLKFKNDKKSNLGIPLPKGKIKIYKEDKDDNSLEFIGEDRIEHTPINEVLRINLGEAFDIKGETKEVSFKRRGEKEYEKEIEIKIKNNKKEEVKIDIVYSNLMGDWEIKDKNTNYVKESNNKLVFPMNLKAESEHTIKFKYSTRY